jgi:hypothetical protein
MRTVNIFVSCGGDMNAHRDLAADAIRRLQQLLQFEMNLSVTINHWDFRFATPDVVPRGALATTSLTNVDRSDALIAIFGRRVPVITRQEIHEAFARRQRGEVQAIFVFANPDQLSDAHREFFAEVENAFGEEIVFGHYSNRLTFQAALYTMLFRYLFEQLGTANPALMSGAAA